MNPEEHHLAQWLKRHETPALLAFVDSEFRAAINSVSVSEPDVMATTGYEAWVTRQGLTVPTPLETTPFNFARFLIEGGFQESFERIGSFYALHAYPNDGRRKVRLRQIWTPSAWALLEESVRDVSPTQDLDVVRTMTDELQSTQIKEWVCAVGLFAFSCAAGRRYWRQTELISARLDPTMRRTLRGFVARNQLSDREKFAPKFRSTLGKILGHGEH